MEAQGTRFVKGVVPKSIEKLSDGTLKASHIYESTIYMLQQHEI
jgi:hypothetical protein